MMKIFAAIRTLLCPEKKISDEQKKKHPCGSCGWWNLQGGDMEMSEICDEDGMCNIIKRFYKENPDLPKPDWQKPCWHAKWLKQEIVKAVG